VRLTFYLPVGERFVSTSDGIHRNVSQPAP
jgi:hypothetical protein